MLTTNPWRAYLQDMRRKARDKKPTDKVTLGVKVLREERRMAQGSAQELGYKSIHSWLETIFRREYTAALNKMLSEREHKQNAPVLSPQPSPEWYPHI